LPETGQVPVLLLLEQLDSLTAPGLTSLLEQLDLLLEQLDSLTAPGLTSLAEQLDSLLEQLVEQLDSLTAPGLASVAVHDESHVPQQADSDRAPALASSVFSAESQATRARAQQQKAMFRKRFIEWDSSGGYMEAGDAERGPPR
jgi:hypothetical protein